MLHKAQGEREMGSDFGILQNTGRPLGSGLGNMGMQNAETQRRRGRG